MLVGTQFASSFVVSWGSEYIFSGETGRVINNIKAKKEEIGEKEGERR